MLSYALCSATLGHLATVPTTAGVQAMQNQVKDYYQRHFAHPPTVSHTQEGFDIWGKLLHCSVSQIEYASLSVYSDSEWSTS